MKKESIEGLIRNYLTGYLRLSVKNTENPEEKYQFEVIDLFMNNLKQIDEINYRILVMFYYKNHSWKYISSELNMSARACQSRRDKMISELREMLRF